MALSLLQLGDERGLGRALAIGACHAIFWAVRHDYLGVLQALLERGADAAKSDDVCGSPLLFAVEQRRTHAAVALLGAGAWAKEGQKERIVDVLCDQGLIHRAELACTQTTGMIDSVERQRLVVAALGAEAPREALLAS
mmetsp:Transcript_58541/g.131681  ORF Transcript_58541/g.131681 Transcript_58541/m.131681 type:complete len:139 (-) Transcript_58541:174-590(-)